MNRAWTSLRLVFWITVAIATWRVWSVSAEKSSSPPLPPGVSLLRDVPYRLAEGRRLALDLYLPDDGDSPSPSLRPVLIAVHGGSWIGGSKTDYGPQFARLAQHGLIVAVVDYRLARPSAPSWDGALADLIVAGDWLQAHSGEYRIDPDRIATIGTSSGGLLAALFSTADQRIRASICISTPMSLIKLMADRTLTHEPALLFLGADHQGLLARAEAASPITHATAGHPPMLMIHGVDDAWVLIKQARVMHERLDEVGVPNRLIEIEGARHGFQLKVGEPNPRDLLPDVLSFLNGVWETSNPS